MFNELSSKVVCVCFLAVYIAECTPQDTCSTMYIELSNLRCCNEYAMCIFQLCREKKSAYDNFVHPSYH